MLNSVDYLPVQTQLPYMYNELLNGLCVWPRDNPLAQAREVIFSYRRTNNIKTYI